jgi:hypothetical protein
VKMCAHTLHMSQRQAGRQANWQVALQKNRRGSIDALVSTARV